MLVNTGQDLSCAAGVPRVAVASGDSRGCPPQTAPAVLRSQLPSCPPRDGGAWTPQWNLLCNLLFLSVIILAAVCGNRKTNQPTPLGCCGFVLCAPLHAQPEPPCAHLHKLRELVTPQPVTRSEFVFIELFHTVNTHITLLYADLLSKNEFLGTL